MKVEFIPINYHDLKDCAIIARWYNDPELNYLITPNFSPQALPPVTAESIQSSHLYSAYEKYAYFMLCDGAIIGDVSLVEHPDYLYDATHHSAWLGIMIASPSHRGQGIGKQAMAYIEDKAYLLGFRRIELGVFAFNTPAIRFYKKCGYRYIGRIPHATFVKGSWYDDLRYEKFLTDNNQG